MSKVKKSVTALLLLSFLACPTYGNNLQNNMLNCQNIRNLSVCSDKSKQIVKK